MVLYTKAYLKLNYFYLVINLMILAFAEAILLNLKI